jgi:hypothetical protein
LTIHGIDPDDNDTSGALIAIVIGAVAAVGIGGFAIFKLSVKKRILRNNKALSPTARSGIFQYLKHSVSFYLL